MSDEHLSAVLDLTLREFLERVGASIYAVKRSVELDDGSIFFEIDGEVVLDENGEMTKLLRPPEAGFVRVTLSVDFRPRSSGRLLKLRRTSRVGSNLAIVALHRNSKVVRLATNFGGTNRERESAAKFTWEKGKWYRLLLEFEVHPGRHVKLILADGERHLAAAEVAPHWGGRRVRPKGLLLQLGVAAFRDLKVEMAP